MLSYFSQAVVSLCQLVQLHFTYVCLRYHYFIMLSFHLFEIVIISTFFEVIVAFDHQNLINSSSRPSYEEIPWRRSCSHLKDKDRNLTFKSLRTQLFGAFKGSVQAKTFWLLVPRFRYGSPLCNVCFSFFWQNIFRATLLMWYFKHLKVSGVNRWMGYNFFLILKAKTPPHQMCFSSFLCGKNTNHSDNIFYISKTLLIQT